MEKTGSDHLERDIRELRYRVTGIDNSVDLLLRANRKEITADLLEFFGKSNERVRVFLAIDGVRTVGDIAKKVKPITLTHVSRRITELLEEDLIYLKSTKRGKVYEMTRKVKILNLEKALRKKFDMN